MTQHTIRHERENSDREGNVRTTTPACSCGWRGHPVAAYNHDQLLQLKKQADRHKSAVHDAG